MNVTALIPVCVACFLHSPNGTQASDAGGPHTG
jgi:hypothetical protein